MGILGRFGITHEKKAYHAEVYCLDEIEDVIRVFGMSDDRIWSDYSESHKKNLEVYIKVQLWTDLLLQLVAKNVVS